MEENQKKTENRKTVLKWILAIIALIGFIRLIKTEAKCKTLVGELKNQKETCDGLVKTIKETSYQLGKKAAKHERI